MTRQLPVRIGYEYPARPRKHQVPCPHRQGVGYGAFCISGTCTSLERCNTLDFVPKSCAKGAAPSLESLLTSPVGDVDSPHKKLSQMHTRLSAARRRHFCGSVITHYNPPVSDVGLLKEDGGSGDALPAGSVITHYDTFIPAVCKV